MKTLRQIWFLFKRSVVEAIFGAIVWLRLEPRILCIFLLFAIAGGYVFGSLQYLTGDFNVAFYICLCAIASPICYTAYQNFDGPRDEIFYRGVRLMVAAWVSGIFAMIGWVLAELR
jgi:hypothetical protein